MRLRQAPHETYSLRVLSAFAVVAVLLTLWQYQAWTAKTASLPERVAQRLLWPLQRGVTGACSWTHDVGVAVFGMRTLAEENRRLKDEVGRLQDDKLLLVQDALEGKAIRERLGFASPQPTNLVPARVIGHSSGGRRRRIRIQAVSGRKLEEGNIVREARGLVGRVVKSDGATAEVILLTDQENAVSGRVLRSGAEGMVYAATDVDAGPVCLKIEKLTSHADLRDGDIVVTAGYTDVYPPGLPIGFIDSVQRAAASSAAITGFVRPFVDFDNLNYVYVVRHGK